MRFRGFLSLQKSSKLVLYIKGMECLIITGEVNFRQCNVDAGVSHARPRVIDDVVVIQAYPLPACNLLNVCTTAIITITAADQSIAMSTQVRCCRFII
ncbi:hypothetical protein T4B_1324 [Trichinella pseudospiralis]|uniref:Uncharacterized protein n=1 Tax=Trichinella pseudospiralis TaxID=6337 RepID=A0A0V1IPW3_TRIPS|nr:hypothetical protein T4B_1324 [Trichinella pseudospiralis]